MCPEQGAFAYPVSACKPRPTQRRARLCLDAGVAIRAQPSDHNTSWFWHNYWRSKCAKQARRQRPIYKVDKTNQALSRFISVWQLILPNIEANDTKLKIGLMHGHCIRHPGSGGAETSLGIQTIPGTMRVLSQVLVQRMSRPRLCETLVKILEFGAIYQGQKSVEQ